MGVTGVTLFLTHSQMAMGCRTHGWWRNPFRTSETLVLESISPGNANVHVVSKWCEMDFATIRIGLEPSQYFHADWRLPLATCLGTAFGSLKPDLVECGKISKHSSRFQTPECHPGLDMPLGMRATLFVPSGQHSTSECPPCEESAKYCQGVPSCSPNPRDPCTWDSWDG